MSDEQFDSTTSQTEPPHEFDVRSTSPASSTARTSTACMYRRILLVVATVVCLVLGVYFKHFHRLPTEDILAANMASLEAVADDDYYNDDEVSVVSDARKSQRDWDQWIRRNRFVSIGKLFDKCGENREMNLSCGSVVYSG